MDIVSGPSNWGRIIFLTTLQAGHTGSPFPILRRASLIRSESFYRDHTLAKKCQFLMQHEITHHDYVLQSLLVLITQPRSPIHTRASTKSRLCVFLLLQLRSARRAHEHLRPIHQVHSRHDSVHGGILHVIAALTSSHDSLGDARVLESLTR